MGHLAIPEQRQKLGQFSFVSQGSLQPAYEHAGFLAIAVALDIHPATVVFSGSNLLRSADQAAVIELRFPLAIDILKGGYAAQGGADEKMKGQGFLEPVIVFQPERGDELDGEGIEGGGYWLQVKVLQEVALGESLFVVVKKNCALGLDGGKGKVATAILPLPAQADFTHLLHRVDDMGQEIIGLAKEGEAEGESIVFLIRSAVVRRRLQNIGMWSQGGFSIVFGQRNGLGFKDKRIGAGFGEQAICAGLAAQGANHPFQGMAEHAPQHGAFKGR